MSETVDLFSVIEPTAKQEIDAQNIELPNAMLFYTAALFDQKTSDAYLQALLNEVAWRQEKITLYGKTHSVPRLTAWYADVGRNYTYSGVHANAKSWIQPLLEIKQRVENYCDITFNSVLVNLYRDGSDGVAWHSDNEPELGQPDIASLSFGEVRTFQMRMKYNHAKKYSLKLGHGSCLLMSGHTQSMWQHQIPKERAVMNSRINLTFRMIK